MGTSPLYNPTWLIIIKTCTVGAGDLDRPPRHRRGLQINHNPQHAWGKPQAHNGCAATISLRRIWRHVAPYDAQQYSTGTNHIPAINNQLHTCGTSSGRPLQTNSFFRLIYINAPQQCTPGRAALCAAVNCPSDMNCGVRRVNFGLRQMNCAPRIVIWLMNVKILYCRGGRPRPPAAPSARSAFRNYITALRQSDCPLAGRPVAVPYKQTCFPAHPYKCAALMEVRLCRPTT